MKAFPVFLAALSVASAGVIPHGAVIGSAHPPTVALEHPGQITSQYHSQDELGQYSYGYAGGPSAKEEIKTADGVTRGGYSYIDGNGIVQSAAYVSDPVNGFRVAATNLPAGPAVPDRKIVAVESAPVAVPVAPVTQIRTVAAAPAALVATGPAAVVAAAPAPVAVVGPSPAAVEAHIEAQAAAKAAVEAEIKASAQAEADTAQAVADIAQSEADNIQAQADAVQDAADSIQSADELIKTVPVVQAAPVVKVGGPVVVADNSAAIAHAQAAANRAAIEDQIALEGAKVGSLGVISVPSQINAVENVAPAVIVSSTPRPTFDEVRIVSTGAPSVVRVSADVPAPVYESPVITKVSATVPVIPSTIVSSVGPAPAQLVSSGVIAKEVIPAAPVTVVKTPVVHPPTVALEHPGQITSQYHSQDELGQYSYGYAGGPSAKEEIKTADGVTKGGYAYIDAHGQVQQAAYVSDPVNGFRVAATNLPQQRLPEYIPDSPEVEHAKQRLFHLQAEHIAKL